MLTSLMWFGTRAEVKKLAIQHSEAYPGLVEAMKMKASDPDSASLGAVAAASKAPS